MVINFNKFDFSSFNKRECLFCGQKALLVYPQHIGVKWNQRNKIFRSSIWDKKGNLLSGGFFKFVNVGENPEHFPLPTTLKNSNIVTKIDGSLVICDYVSNQFNFRTRGTINALTLENYNDFVYCFKKYPKVEKWLKKNNNYSLLFEIVTPNLKIVLNYGDKPDLFLVGCVNKKDYSLLTQQKLDELGKEFQIQRPSYFEFSDLDSLVKQIQIRTDIEGVVLYTDKDQILHKQKTDFYCKLHRLKNEMGSFERIVDFYFANVFSIHHLPTYKDFYTTIENALDYEVAEQCKNQISIICDGMKKVVKIREGMYAFVAKTHSEPTRKEQALKIISAYGKTNRGGFVFKLLDGKELATEDYKKLLYQVVKK